VNYKELERCMKVDVQDVWPTDEEINKGGGNIKNAIKQAAFEVRGYK
jgi:hypothetical protein